MDNLDGMQPGEYVDRISHSYIYIYILFVVQWEEERLWISGE